MGLCLPHIYRASVVVRPSKSYSIHLRWPQINPLRFPFPAVPRLAPDRLRHFYWPPKAATQRGAVNHSKRRRKKNDGRAQNEEFILVLSGTSPNSHPSAYGHSSSKYETRNTDNRTPATGPEGRQSQGVVGWRVNTKGNGAEICGTCLGRKG